VRRVLHVTNIPTPYRVPQLNEMHRQFAEQGYELRVAFGGLGYSRRKWEVDLGGCAFDYYVLKHAVKVGRGSGRVVFLYGGLYRVLAAFRPDVVTVTGFSAATAKLWLLSLVTGLRYVIFSGSVAARHEGGWRGVPRRVLAARAAGGVAYGTKAREYLASLGIPAESVAIAINTVDVQFFKEAVERVAVERVAVERVAAERQGDGHEAGPKRLLVISYLSRDKRLTQLLRVIAALAARRDDFVLDVVGDGEDRANLEAFVRQHGLGERVRFHGFRQREELPAFLARSHCFLFQTGLDIWGLVLNEAMAAGLPCVVSPNAGGACDLVVEGRTGFVVDYEDVSAAAARIEYLLDHPEAARRMGAEGQRFVLTHASLERSARGFVEAVLAAERVPAPPVEAAAYAPTGASGGPGRTGEAAP